MSLAQANALLRAAGLPEAWTDTALWRVLALAGDAGDAGDGNDGLLTFLACWRLWRATPARPKRLHCVLILPRLPDLVALRMRLANRPASRPIHAALAQQLIDQCEGLTCLALGFQRLSFDEGQVLLTVCIGELKPMLRAQQFQADSLLVCSLPMRWGELDWDRWSVKALAQCCRRGCAVAGHAVTAGAKPFLAQGGFEIEPAGLPATGSTWRARFAPRWQIKHSRQLLAVQAQSPGRCAVIGAGLAGASVAAALACRGWQVQVLDGSPKPASGASGLPVGLLCPEVSRDDNPRSRLSRAGLRLTLQELRSYLTEGKDWGATGVRERRLQDGVEMWHPQGAWVKPQALIRAWLGRPGVQFQGGAQVAALRYSGHSGHSDKGWQLFNASGQCLASAYMVVIAAAGATQALLDSVYFASDAGDTGDALPGDFADNGFSGGGANRLRHRVPEIALLPLPALRAVHGQLSWGLHPATGANGLPPCPVNGHGHLVAHVPQPDGLAWYAGATYETQNETQNPNQNVGQFDPASDRVAHAHAANFARLQHLLPEAAEALRGQFESAAGSGILGHWRNTRYASTDRMPVAGPLMAGDQPTLWASTAFGSRGLSWAVLCAELIAARLGCEPLPIDQELARRIDSRRFWKETGRFPSRDIDI